MSHDLRSEHRAGMPWALAPASLQEPPPRQPLLFDGGLPYRSEAHGPCGDISRCYFPLVSAVRAKQLNQETGTVLNQLRRHATVMREGFEVPLIGVPRDAVLEVCDSCGETIGLSQSTFTGTQMLCPNCMVEPPC